MFARQLLIRITLNISLLVEISVHSFPSLFVYRYDEAKMCDHCQYTQPSREAAYFILL